MAQSDKLKGLEVDEDEFLKDPQRWNKAIAAWLAKDDGVDTHWQVLRYATQPLSATRNLVLHGPYLPHPSSGQTGCAIPCFTARARSGEPAISGRKNKNLHAL